MTEINRILSETRHRPFSYPTENWKYYQEWNNALFLHWKVPVDLLRQVVPEKLTIDTFEGNAYVSLVAFTMQKIRPRNLPSVKFVSEFGEINIRTYIKNSNKNGVYFLSIEAEKPLSVFIARTVSGLPYEKSGIKRTNRNYLSMNIPKGFYLDAAFEVKELLSEETELDRWLTERYCLYLEKGEIIYRYDTHHEEWALKKVALHQLNLKYKVGEVNLTNTPDLMHYSNGVKVIAWGKSRL